MRRTLLSLFASFAFLLGFSLTAQAHVADTLMWRPYVIEKTCNDHFKHCTARMKYAAGQNPGTARPGTYFFQTANKGRHGDFRLLAVRPAVHHHVHPVKHRKVAVIRHKTAHRVVVVKAHNHPHCRKTGWGFDSITGTYAYMPRSCRCLKSYDRQ